MEALAAISKQLKKNAQFKTHGPGLPTAVSIHSKFIAVGTSRSLVRAGMCDRPAHFGCRPRTARLTQTSLLPLPQVLVFDHFQEVRQVLQTSASGGAETDGPVTAIDVSRGNDYLVCGYLSGRIVLWDILRGVTLKSTNDMHNSPVSAIKFVK